MSAPTFRMFPEIQYPAVWSAPIVVVAYVKPIPLIARGSYAGIAWSVTTGTRYSPQTFPTIDVPPAMILASGVGLAISLTISRTFSPSPQGINPPSIAVATATATSILSTPTSSIARSIYAIVSKSLMPASAPSPQIVSYSKPLVMYLPCLSGYH